MLQVKTIKNRGDRGYSISCPHINDQISDEMYVQITHTCEKYIPGQQIFQKETG